MSGASDVWASGPPYEQYVGRWSRVVAPAFVDWLAVGGGARWLDVGCGTGALTETVLALARPREVVGLDPSEGFVAYARQRVGDDRASFVVGDAQSLPFESGAFDTAVAGLVLNFVPEPIAAVSEMARVVTAGGVVGAYVWDYAEGMELMRYFWDTAGELDPRAKDLDEALRFKLAGAAALKELLVTAGLANVETRAIDVPTVFQDLDDYWSPFLGGQGPAPSYVASLAGDEQTRLRDRLRARLPARGDGAIALSARAWAVRGTRA